MDFEAITVQTLPSWGEHIHLSFDKNLVETMYKLSLHDRSKALTLTHLTLKDSHYWCHLLHRMLFQLEHVRMSDVKRALSHITQYDVGLTSLRSMNSWVSEFTLFLWLTVLARRIIASVQSCYPNLLCMISAEWKMCAAVTHLVNLFSSS